MTVFVKAPLLAVCGLAMMGCDRSGYESKPVVLKHEMGAVTCQLYTVERTYWDQAIAHPESMSKELADSVCRAEGERQKAAYNSARKPT